MNKNLTLTGLVLALLALVAVAEEKETSKASAKGKAEAAAPAEHKLLTPSELQWGAAPAGLPAGSQLAVMEGDPTKSGPFTVRMKSPDGYKIMPHTHPTAEHVTVISGTLRLGMGEKFDETAARELPVGGFAVLPAGMAHFAATTGETIVQIHGQGPFKIKYVNPADDPRNAKK